MSQLRSFKFYSNVAPVLVSPTLPGNNAATTGTIGCNLVNLSAYVSAANWLQLFDSATSPAGGTVPLKSINVAAAGMIQNLLYSIGPVRTINGLWMAMSSTEATYTAAATSFDVWGELEEWEYPRDGVLTKGPSGVQSTYQIWSEATGPKVLKRLTVVELGGVQSYIMIFAIDNPAANNIPDYPPIPIAANGTRDLYFQLSPFRKDTSIVGSAPSGVTTNDFATHTGCSVAISTDPTKLVTGGADFYAEYVNSGVYP